jgi:hypothetical protein
MKCTEALHSHRRRGRKEREEKSERGRGRVVATSAWHSPCSPSRKRKKYVRVPKKSADCGGKKIEGRELTPTLLKAVATKLWLILNMHPHPASELQPLCRCCRGATISCWRRTTYSLWRIVSAASEGRGWGGRKGKMGGREERKTHSSHYSSSPSSHGSPTANASSIVSRPRPRPTTPTTTRTRVALARTVLHLLG